MPNLHLLKSRTLYLIEAYSGTLYSHSRTRVRLHASFSAYVFYWIMKSVSHLKVLLITLHGYHHLWAVWRWKLCAQVLTSRYPRITIFTTYTGCMNQRQLIRAFCHYFLGNGHLSYPEALLWPQGNSLPIGRVTISPPGTISGILLPPW